MKAIYLSRIGRTINVPEETHFLISVYKIFFPPTKEIQLGKSKKVLLMDLELAPPPEQEKML